jgi:AcrR family transcriptional regulator
VAARAGVGKTTIYRRWPNKEALIVGALAAVKTPLIEPPGVSIRDDLLTIAGSMSAERAHRHARCFWNVVGSAEKYPELFARYHHDVIMPRREVLRRVLRRGVERGELRPGLDLDVAVALLVGSLAHKTPQDRIPEGYAEAVVDLLLDGMRSPDKTIDDA